MCDLKFERVSQNRIDDYREECEHLLFLIGERLAEDVKPEEWAESCYITDESCLCDFFMSRDPETPANLKVIEAKIGFPVEGRMYICDIAKKMRETGAGVE